MSSFFAVALLTLMFFNTPDQPPQGIGLAGMHQTIGRHSMLRADALRKDLATLRRSYELLHPGLYRYQTKASMTARWDATDQYFSQDRSLADAFLELTRLTAAVKCGHSYPNFWNQSARVAEALFEGHDRVPFHFRWLDRKMIVTGDHSGGALPRGTQVLVIDGIETGLMLDSLLPLARADGANDHKRVAYLEVQGNPRWHAFDILRALRFPPRDTLITLKVRRPGERMTASVVVRALTAGERRTIGDRSKPDTGLASWHVSERETGSSGVAIIRMPTWSLYNAREAARVWTDSVLSDLEQRRVSALILDLRENEGGIDAGNQFLAHLTSVKLPLPIYRRHVRYRVVPEDLLPFLSTWDSTFRNWGADVQGPLDTVTHPLLERLDLYRLTRWDDDPSGADVIHPVAPRYTGRVFVLIGAVNSSATFQFALAAKQTGLATLVGQSTGGNRRGINGGAFFFLRLRETGIEVDLPLVAGFPASPQPDAGIEPDVFVQPTIKQITEGRDAELERALELARTSRIR
ncbi:MAG: peptidase S41 [Gemmatimonadaceae bacterium]|nr:peptidase S41 [Gemmatimonadaceae bacterium]